MIYIAVTRFNETTFQEFQNFYKEKNINNCIYNVPVPIKQKFDKDSLKFSLDILEKSNVAVSPGVGFGKFGEGYIRIALVENKQRIRQAMKNIKAAL